MNSQIVINKSSLLCSQYCDAAPAVQKCSSTQEVTHSKWDILNKTLKMFKHILNETLKIFKHILNKTLKIFKHILHETLKIFKHRGGDHSINIWNITVVGNVQGIQNVWDIQNVQDIEHVVHTATPKVAYTSLQIFRGEMKIQSR